jgi:transposase
MRSPPGIGYPAGNSSGSSECSTPTTRPARSAPPGSKKLLRQLLAQREPIRIRQAFWRFYDACAEANMRETTRLALTIETWWPAILVALTEQVTNARTEGFSRVIKEVKRVACGFRNMDNYRTRIMAHIAVSRPRLQPA